MKRDTRAGEDEDGQSGDIKVDSVNAACGCLDFMRRLSLLLNCINAKQEILCFCTLDMIESSREGISGTFFSLFPSSSPAISESVTDFFYQALLINWHLLLPVHNEQNQMQARQQTVTIESLPLPEIMKTVTYRKITKDSSSGFRSLHLSVSP